MPKFDFKKKLPTFFGKSKSQEDQIREHEANILKGRYIYELVNSESYQKGLAPIMKDIQDDCILKLRRGKDNERMSGMLDCIDLIISRINETTITAEKSAKILTKLKDK